MPTTTNYGFYSPPLTGVTPNVPRDTQTLANAVDTALKAEETARISGDAMVMSSRQHTAGASITHNTWTTVNFNVMELDEIPWDNTNSRFTVPTAGYYLVDASVLFNSNATGLRGIRIQVNGATVASAQFTPMAAATGATISRGFKLAASDLVLVQVFQTSGGALTITTSVSYAFVNITRVGR